jgi:hypothetical protein
VIEYPGGQRFEIPYGPAEREWALALAEEVRGQSLYQVAHGTDPPLAQAGQRRRFGL